VRDVIGKQCALYDDFGLFVGRGFVDENKNVSFVNEENARNYLMTPALSKFPQSTRRPARTIRDTHHPKPNQGTTETDNSTRMSSASVAPSVHLTLPRCQWT